jgi:hypothetical protein
MGAEITLDRVVHLVFCGVLIGIAGKVLWSAAKMIHVIM